MKVKLRDNLRHFDTDDSNFYISANEEKELPDKELRSYTIKYHLLHGNLIPLEGECLLNIKHSKVLFSAELHPICYGTEFSKFFKKNLDSQELFWIDKDEVINLDSSIYLKLTGEEVIEDPEEVIEDPEEVIEEVEEVIEDPEEVIEDPEEVIEDPEEVIEDPEEVIEDPVETKEEETEKQEEYDK